MSYYAHPSAVVDPGAEIGAGSKIWHFVHIMGTARVGEDCICGQNVFLGEDVIIGDRVKVQNNVSVFAGVECEDEVFLGPSAVFTNVINPRSGVERKDEYRKTLVKKGASIGANATVLCGLSIGKYAMLGAGAVVTKDVKDFETVVGNPATHLSWVSRNGHTLKFDGEGLATCSETGEEYRLSDGIVKMIQ